MPLAFGRLRGQHANPLQVKPSGGSVAPRLQAGRGVADGAASAARGLLAALPLVLGSFAGAGRSRSFGLSGQRSALDQRSDAGLDHRLTWLDAS